MNLLHTPAKVMGTLYLANTIYPFKIKCKDATLTLMNENEQVYMDENSMAVLKGHHDYTIKKNNLHSSHQTLNGEKDYSSLKRKAKLSDIKRALVPVDLKKSKSANTLSDKPVMKKHTAEQSSKLLTCLKMPSLQGHVFQVGQSSKNIIQLNYSHNVIRLFYLDKIQEPFDAYPLSSNAIAYVDDKQVNLFRIVFPRLTLTFEALTRHQAIMWVSLINTACLYLGILEEAFYIDIDVLEKTWELSNPKKPTIQDSARWELELLNDDLNEYDLPNKGPSVAPKSPNAFDYFAILASPVKTNDIKTPIDGKRALEGLLDVKAPSDEALMTKVSEKLLSRLSSIVTDDNRNSCNFSMANSSSAMELRSSTIESFSPASSPLRMQTKLRTNNRWSVISPVTRDSDENIQQEEIVKVLQLFTDEREASETPEPTAPEALPVIEMEATLGLNTVITPKIDELGRPNVVYTMKDDKEELTACSIDMMVELIASSENASDPNWLWLALLTTPIYCSSKTLIKKFITRINIDKKAAQESELFNIRVRLLRAVYQWYEWFPHDFQSTEMQILYPSFLKLVSLHLNTEYSGLLSNISTKMLFVVSKKLLKTTANPRFSSPHIVNRRKSFQISELQPREYSPMLFAQEYTRLDFDLFAQINPKTFLYQLHTKDAESIVTLLNSISFFNKMTTWFSSRFNEEINEMKPFYVEWLIYLAAEFENLNNFNGLMAVILSWNQIKVPHLPEELIMEMKRLEDTMSMFSNFRSYRKLLHEVTAPCVPFLGLYIKDLYFIEEGNSSVNDNLINIVKLKMISEKSQKLKTWQSKPYQFHDTKEGHELYDMLYLQ